MFKNLALAREINRTPAEVQAALRSRSDDTRLLLHFPHSKNVICCLSYHPLAVRLPPAEQLVVSNGELQIELQLGQEKVRKAFSTPQDKRIRSTLSFSSS